MLNKYLYFVSAAHMCDDISPGSLPAILPFFVSEYGMNYTDVAGLMFASSFLASFTQPLFGYIADKAPRHWFMSLGIIISGLSLAVTGFINNYWLIFLFIMLMGIGGSIFHPEAARLINAISGERRGSGMGIFSVGGNAGYGIGPLLAVVLLSTFGMKGLLFYGIISIIMGLAIFIYTPKMIQSVKELPTLTPEEKKQAEVQASQKATSATNDWFNFGRLTLFITCRSIVGNSILSFLPLFCISVLGTSKAVGSSTMSVLSIAGIFATVIGGWMSDRLGYIKVLKIWSFFLIPVMAVIAYSYNIKIIYLMMLPFALGFNGSYSSFVVLGQNYLAKNIGFASGVTLGLSMTVGGIVAPVLGWVGDNYGLPLVMTIVVIVSVLSALCPFLLTNPESK